MRRHEDAIRLVLPDVAADLEKPVGRARQPRDAAQGGGLAGAGRAKERCDAASRQLQVNVEREAGIGEAETRGDGAVSHCGRSVGAHRARGERKN